MERHTFKKHARYVNAQQTITRRRLSRDVVRCFTNPTVVGLICKHRSEIPFVGRGLCQGVRLGQEVDMFNEALPDFEWIGTEITPECCDGKKIIEHDFTQCQPEWIGEFDAIYTNSFDHARDPFKVGRIWMSYLNAHGRLYIEWTPWHDKIGRRGNKADCFAASLGEYIELFNTVGRVEHVLTTPSGKDWGDYHVLVVR